MIYNILTSTQSADTLYYLSIYAGLSIATCVVTILRAGSFAIGTFKASKLIHSKLYHQMTRATILFFDSTPIGRILNRFSSDLYTIDFDLPFNLNIFLAQIFSLIGALIITIYGLPLIIILLLLLSVFYFLLQHFYRRTSRELKRIASISMSPVYSHFTETFTGIATIKGMRAAERFFLNNIENVDRNQQANFTSNIASGWFRIRIQAISIVVVTGVGLFAVLQHQFLLPVNPGLLGLALSYAITLTGILGSTIETFTQLEMLMVAIERIDEYSNNTPVENILALERKERHHEGRVIYWTARAPSVTFDNVTLEYREGLPRALKGVTFHLDAGEKLGVAGRTGAGKSSLIRVLFRLVEICGGRILLDNVDIMEYSLQDLRTNLAAIPQDPFLFSGTVRENLSPDTKRFNDGDYWSSLEDTYLKTAVQKMGGLDANVGIGGKKFSVGQKQLLCLARAILTKPKVLCIDEATANIDSETDTQIQNVIQTKFYYSTVITIAHRVNTILHCDKILVMENGRVVEFSTPKALLNDPNSGFYLLATQSI
ncbi:hypothetical protein LOD99_4621 [Oopsacas minuta]|uniref:Uncharacterized protein n=1 Tax=Oopsacas minuta TaxID=111878 RepID=A0AAV7JV34_9METZ|nr:hypothetical protein LOD99_4621 [Oopsacas minuta]